MKYSTRVCPKNIDHSGPLNYAGRWG